MEYHTVGSAFVLKGVFGDFDRNASDHHGHHLDNRANFARPADSGDPHPDDLFRDMDGRQIAQSSGVWLVFVSAIHTVGTHRWLQVALSGTPSYSLILKASDQVGSSRALDAIGAWLMNTLRTDRIIAVD